MNHSQKPSRQDNLMRAFTGYTTSLQKHNPPIIWNIYETFTAALSSNTSSQIKKALDYWSRDNTSRESLCDHFSHTALTEQ